MSNRPANPHPIRLQGKEGQDLLLVTDDPVVGDRVTEARLARTLEVFVYWTGNEEETIVGKVTQIWAAGTEFRFSVKAEEA